MPTINRVIFSLDAFEDYKYWESQDSKIIKRINALIADILRNGNEGIGKPEPLKGNLAGFYSRRIDDKNRIIYRIEENVLFITACKTHYQDK